MFSAIYRPGKGKSFSVLEDAVIFAREKVKSSKGAAITIWNKAKQVVIGIVTDDAYGVTVHRLADWPADEPCAN